MKILKATLNPFGGLSNKTLSLHPGLTVVLGPNEAGKSTYFNAMQSALLMPVKYRKNSPEAGVVNAFIPVGGNTAHIELQFSCDEALYTLSKTWGAGQACTLKLPDGALLGDEATVTERLNELLPVSDAVCRSVLMVRQNQLAYTRDHIRGDSATLQTLGDILRSAVQETDGVSVDEFLARLEELHAELYSRWDTSADGPENNRGIASPYKKDVGAILGAFYAKEQLRVDLENASAYDEKLDELNNRVLGIQAKLSTAESFIAENRTAVEAARERRVFEAQHAVVNNEAAVMQRDNQEWPVVREKHARIKEEISTLETRHVLLQKEEQAAKAAEAGRVFRERLARAKPEQEALAKLDSSIKGLKAIKPADLDQLRKAQAKINTAEAALAAGKLTLEFLAKKNIAINSTADLDNSTELSVAQGTTETIKAGARIRLEHPDWSITVTSGDQKNIEGTEKAVAEARAGLQTLLSTLAFGSVDETVEALRVYTEAQRAVDQQRSRLGAMLEGMTFEELAKKVTDAGTVTETRPLIDVTKESIDTGNTLVNLRKEYTQLDKRLAELAKTYEDTDNLLLKVAEAVHSKKELAGKISALAPMPVGVADAEEFVRKYERIEADQRILQQQVGELQVERARMEGAAPDRSSEELNRLFCDANDEFVRVRAHAQALTRVRDAAVSLSQSAGDDTYAGLEKEMVRLTAAITAGRHTRIEMDGSVPEGFVCEDGKTLGYDILSSGTKDVLALSLRLAMAGCFLKNTEGFIIMDDPLVDMDPERQAGAARVLKEFAEKTQVVLFTCHPGHAELFGQEAIINV